MRFAVDHDAVFFSEIFDQIRIEPTHAIKVAEIFLIEKIKNVGDMAGVPGCIQFLQLYDGLFSSFTRLAMDRGAATLTRAHGLQLPAAERPDRVDPAGMVGF